MRKKTFNLALILMGILACSVSADLVGYWSFDEGEGTVANDGSGNDNHGEVVGGAQWGAGKVGGALSFDGSDDMVVIEQNFGLPIYNNGTDNVWSIAMWVKGAPQNDMRVFSEASTANNNPLFNLGTKNNGATGQLDCYIRPAGMGHTFSDAEPFDDTWHHIAWVDADGAVTLYVDGLLDGGDFNYTRAELDLDTTTIGGILRANPSHWFTGMIDDVQIYNHALTEDEVLAAMDGLSPKQFAADPGPEDEQIDVLRDDVALTWEPGKFAGTHNVYVGTSFEDVNTATTPTSEGLSETSLAMDRLEFGQTYYWRVDEVNGTPDKTVFKGEVWSFTAEPYSISIPGADIAVTASSSSNEFSIPDKTIDGSGLGDDDVHAIASETMWFTASVDLDPWIQFEFDGVKKLDIMTVWNSNGAAESAIGWGVKDVQIEYSADGENWDVLEGATQISRAPGLPTYNTPDEIDFGGAVAKVVRVNIQSNWGGVLMSYGLSEVQFSRIPAEARTPVPASGSVDVMPNATVTWRAGREAAEHSIYVDADQNAVADGTAPSVTSNTNSLDLGSLDLGLGQTYYWRVDEVNAAEAVTAWAGPAWSFTTPTSLVIDDFDAYTNISPDRPFQAWLDGFGYSADEFFPTEYPGNGTGSGVGHDIWSLSSPYYDGSIMETTIVYGGSQSMPLYYGNTGGTASETQRTFDAPQDWTAGGVQSLSIMLYGTAGNTGQLYVKINSTKITGAPDISIEGWQAWIIDLSTVAGNLQSVQSMTIGVDGAGATGMLYIDEIRLYPKLGELITPVDPGADGLVASYSFEGNASDVSGNGNDGTLNGDVGFAAGQVGQAIDCDGIDDYVSTGKVASDLGIGGNNARTISAWVFTRTYNNGGIYDVGARVGGQDFSLRTLATDDTWRIQYWGGDSDFTLNATDKWVHFTHVHDGVATKIYANGMLIVDWEKTIDTTDVNPFQIGLYGWPGNFFDGLIDEVRVYNRALSASEALSLAGFTTPISKPF